jgi:hypothetical protein
MFDLLSMNLLIHFRTQFRKSWQLLQKLFWVLRQFLISWLAFTTITLIFSSSHPVDAFFVLGGSIQQEIYLAQLATQYPHIPILISSGSEDPCI